MLDKLFNKKNKITKAAESKQREIKSIDDYTEIFKTIYEELGISDLHKRPILYDRLSLIAKNYEIETSEKFIEIFRKKDAFYEEVIDAVTVNETYFFRELDSLEWLVDWIKSQNKDIRVLSIPSSNGAEIYSILIMLDKIDSSLIQKINCIGIDVNNESIKKAYKAVYSERELHKLDQDTKLKYFKKSDRYMLIDELKNRVEFINDNIFSLSSSKYGKFDVILSRNLFIYFDDLHRKKATEILYDILKPGGYLIMGVTDRLYEGINFNKISNFVYKKT